MGESMKASDSQVSIFKKFLNKFFMPKTPIIKENTFIVWEPCSKSHAEVVPGYVKYLLDLGYHVSVLVNPARLREGLFDRFQNENISLNKLSKRQIKNFFKKSDLKDVKGVLVTTVGKLCDEVDFDKAYNAFNENVDKSKLYFVSHEAKPGVDAGTWHENLITLRKLNYKNAKSTVINPHYFGDVKILPKNKITNFVMVGAIRPYRKNENTIIEAVKDLVLNNEKKFKITIIGKGEIKDVPYWMKDYFVVKGRLPFRKMYDELEKADFLLTSYDEDNIAHQRYNTTGTSGNFQLSYGFLKPCLIIKSFAPLNNFDENNALLYEKPINYSDAMVAGMYMTDEEYSAMQNILKATADSIYKESLENFKRLING